MMTHRKAIEFSYVFLLLLLASSAFCQETLRIMTYNLLNYVATDQSRDVYHRTVIDAADPDVLVVQEMTSQTAVNNFLNNVANFTTAGKYVAGSFNDGPDTDNAIYIKPSKVSVVRNLPIRTALRDINEFMLVHTVSSETLRVYSVHLKASSGSSNEAARAAEVDNLRAVTNALSAGSNFIVVGDFNIYSSNEPAYQKLIRVTAENEGHFIDPISMSGTWNNPTYASYHTQSTRTRSFGGGATGDLDDRFDMILCSNAVSQEGGVTFLPGSYVAFGNDGLHYNDSINKMPNTAVSQSIANALHYASDHLPVIASFIFHPASPAGGAKAANISLTSGNNQSASINTTLSNLFVVKVTDATGAGVHGTTVSFAITSAPSDQTGALLSLSSAVTDASGEASTRLTLGNKVGDYLVSATAAELNGSPIFFVATASVGQPGSIGIESGNFQTGPNKSTLREPMVVRVVDAGGNPVQGAAVSFAITSAPQSAVGQVLSVETASTDQAGRASTFLTLGSRSGTYAVTATSVGLSGTPISFFATAFGAAEEIREASGNNQTATTKAELQQPFVVIVVDVLGNAVPGVPVAFSIASVPVGAVGQSLSIESTMTDQNGQALSVLRLGDKLGAYGVIASSPGLAGNPVVFVAFASSLSSVDRVEQISARLHLLPNYPNPFNPTTTIEFTLPENGRAVLRVFNALGEEVAALFDGEAEAGRIHLAQFDAGRLSSGVYYARLEFKNRQLVRRVLLLR